MKRRQSYLLPFLYQIKRAYSSFKLKSGIKLGLIKSIMIMPYKGFGNEREIYFVARILRDRKIGPSDAQDRRLRNFQKMYKRFMTWEIPHVRVKATFYENEVIAVSDEEGYAEFRIPVPANCTFTNQWEEVHLELLDKVISKQGQVAAINKIFMPSEHLEYGIISDIDDTIVPTGATRLWEMIKTTFLGNAYSRIPFPGVSAFYKAMEKGRDEIESNPLFYVSSSPWNLYDFLMEFLEVHHIPKGPLMLRDIGLSREQLIAGSHFDHKLSQVEKIFEFYGEIPFILIGDSGQHDPEIYLQVIKDYPGRVKMIYIRDVQVSRHAAMEEIQLKMQNLGVEMLLVTDTMDAARHALDKGWILKSDVIDIAETKKEDEEAS
ncbi:App1 family protein [Aquiflexum lacus]|uniref:App1 family protein n=1 Tax=Aquiflexum lacus TaxID=2483805 RepID=UPI001894F0A7|nr:phosphatase domain-containing protein [Aquiflexum lacus]